jgi:hypothetical protein
MDSLSRVDGQKVMNLSATYICAGMHTCSSMCSLVVQDYAIASIALDKIVRRLLPSSACMPNDMAAIKLSNR